MRLPSGDKHHLRKSADRKAQISPVIGTNAFLICAFRSADFFRWCNTLVSAVICKSAGVVFIDIESSLAFQSRC